MTFKTRELTVDLVNEISTKEIRFSQGDRNSAKLVLNITNEGQELDLSQAKAVRITFKKPDGTTVFQEDLEPINAMKGKYQIILKTQTLAAAGNVYGQVRIFEKDQELDAEPFGFTVKQSYSGDGAVESTNEFTIIQKAIEAGEKLEGVDIDGIIAAGELAKGALPKSGGTMTGNIDMDTSVGSKSKGYRWRDATGALFGLESATDGALILYDYKNAARVWQYDPVAKRLTVLSDTNLLKTTGGTMTGTLVMSNANAEINFKDDKSEVVIQKTSTGGIALWDRVNQEIAWQYLPASKEFRVPGATNLLKTTGGKISGLLTFERLAQINQDMPTTASARGFNYMEEGTQTRIGGLGLYRGSATDKPRLYLGWGANPWDGAYALTVSEDSLKYKNKDVAMRDKDGVANITLTTDAELAGANGVVAVRRGNTVSLRAPIRRKAGSPHSAVLFTIPDSMRPVGFTVQQGVISTDGVSATFTVNANGEATIVNPTATDVSGKNFYITCTYVVD